MKSILSGITDRCGGVDPLICCYYHSQGRVRHVFFRHVAIFLLKSHALSGIRIFAMGVAPLVTWLSPKVPTCLASSLIHYLSNGFLIFKMSS